MEESCNEIQELRQQQQQLEQDKQRIKKYIVNESCNIIESAVNPIEDQGIERLRGAIYDILGNKVLNSITDEISKQRYRPYVEKLMEKGHLENLFHKWLWEDDFKDLREALSSDLLKELREKQKQISNWFKELKEKQKQISGLSRDLEEKEATFSQQSLRIPANADWLRRSGAIIALQAQGIAPEPTWLAVKRRSGIVGLAPSPEDKFADTKWRVVTTGSNNIVYLSTLENSPRYLDGYTVNGGIGLASSTQIPPYSGIQWKVYMNDDKTIYLKTLGHIPGLHWLESIPEEGSVRLVGDWEGVPTGTRWKVFLAE